MKHLHDLHCDLLPRDGADADRYSRTAHRALDVSYVSVRGYGQGNLPSRNDYDTPNAMLTYPVALLPRSLNSRASVSYPQVSCPVVPVANECVDRHLAISLSV